MSEAKVVSFRLDSYHADLLAKRAESVRRSAGETARDLVVEALNHDERLASIEAKIEQNEQQILALRDDLNTATRVLLVTAGGVKKVEAEAWVKENLR